MSTLELAMYWLMFAVGLMMSALFSGMETGCYSLNRVRLHLLSHQGDRRADRLANLVAKPATLLITLLIANNIANNMTSSALSVLFDDWQFSDGAIIAATVLIVTPLLFVFGEVLPKDLFAAHADRWLYPLAWLLRLLERLFTWTGVLPLLNLISSAVLRGFGSINSPVAFHPRLQVTTLVKEGVGHGLLSQEQSAIVERVLALAGRTVRDEMIPWKQVVCVRLDNATDRMWQLAERSPHARFPVLDAQNKVVGVVLLIDALEHDKTQCPPINQLMREPVTFKPGTPVREALRTLQHRKSAMAVVLGPGDRPIGLVTIKDLLEPITGELSNW